MQYLEIAVKLIAGMIGILTFLRIAGKAQMAQLTPLDTVSVSACVPRYCDALSRATVCIW